MIIAKHNYNFLDSKMIMILLSNQDSEIIRFFLPDHCSRFETRWLLLKMFETATGVHNGQNGERSFWEIYLKYRAVKKHILIWLSYNKKKPCLNNVLYSPSVLRGHHCTTQPSTVTLSVTHGSTGLPNASLRKPRTDKCISLISYNSKIILFELAGKSMEF